MWLPSRSVKMFKSVFFADKPTEESWPVAFISWYKQIRLDTSQNYSVVARVCTCHQRNCDSGKYNKQRQEKGKA